MAKKSQRSYLRRGRGQKKKPTTGDLILDRLRKMVSTDAEGEDDLQETPTPPPTSEPRSQSKSKGEEEAAKVLKSIFKCSNWFESMSAASSSMFNLLCCYWLCLLSTRTSESSQAQQNDQSVCRKTADYAVIPLMRETPHTLEQPVPRANILAENDASDTDTIPYGRGDEKYRSDEDFVLAPVL